MNFNQILVVFGLSLLTSSALADQCRVVTQCNYCQTNSHFQSVALNQSPSIPPGQDFMQCEAYVINLQYAAIRKFIINMGHEPGFTYQWATETTVANEALSAFEEFSNAHSRVQTLSPIEIPPSIAPSAYDLPRNSSIESAIDDFIRQNHPVVNSLYTTFGSFSEALGVIGLSFDSFLTVMVVFDDGSFGLFILETIGTFSEWRAEESSFQDANGNTVFFNPEDYDNQSGFASGNTLDRLVSYLERSGWTVVGDSANSGNGGAPGCRWICDDVDEWKCTLNCSSQ